MGRAISMGQSQFIGARVAGQLTYIPAYIDAGKKINAKCEIPIYMNGKNRKDKLGDAYKLTAWGKLAEVCCKSLPKGKAIDVFTRQKPYEGDLYDNKGQLRLDAAGQTIRIPKIGFTIYDIIFGEESDKLVSEEVLTGRRPVNWNVPNHQDHTLWTNMLQERQAIVWDGVAKEFGYARVYIPQGPGIQLDFSKPAMPAQVAPVTPVTPVIPAAVPINAGGAGAPDVAAITAAVIAAIGAPAVPVVPEATQAIMSAIGTPAVPVVPAGSNIPLF